MRSASQIRSERSSKSTHQKFCERNSHRLVWNSFLTPTAAWQYRSLWRTISPWHFSRIFSLLLPALIIIPIRFLENLVYGKKIEQEQIKIAPIFIIGHWRSGTTHLHNLITLDPRFAYVTMYQCVAPGCTIFGGKLLKLVLQWFLPATRPMDNMEWSMDAPQEEEIAIGKLSGHACYSMWYFPKNAVEIFNKSVLFQKTSVKFKKGFQKTYLKVLRTAAYATKGKQLVLKNPANTGRIAFILEMFPDAKIIHIHRSPYEVYCSTIHLHKQVRKITSLQDSNQIDDGQLVIDIYEKIMRRFLNDRQLIPEKNFLEIRYENLESNPIEEIQRIYEKFSFPDFDLAKDKIAKYLADKQEYRKNHFDISLREIRAINERLDFSFQEFNYQKITDAPAKRRTQHLG